MNINWSKCVIRGEKHGQLENVVDPYRCEISFVK